MRQSATRSGGAPALYRAIRRHLRGPGADAFGRADAASAHLFAYVIGAAVFLLASSYLVQFAATPPSQTTSLEDLSLRSEAEQILNVLVNTAGYPLAWDGDPEAVQRLGLVEPGMSIRIDNDKFDRLARGRFMGASNVNGFVDYSEARAALGLAEENFHLRDFHLRVKPVFSTVTGDDFGIEGMEDYRVAYIGTADCPTSVCTFKNPGSEEADYLDTLKIGFTKGLAPRNGLAGTSDYFPDRSDTLRSSLVPLIGGAVPQSVISQGSNPKSDFKKLDGTTIGHIVNQEATTYALALYDSSATGVSGFTYGKGREIRATLGTANMSGITAAAKFTWKEYVDTGPAADGGDFGYVEVSPDGGATWFPITNTAADRSQNTTSNPQPAGKWRDRTFTMTSTHCGTCIGKDSVLVALHWVADNDNDRGRGWIVDDFRIADDLDSIASTGFQKNFERPEYDLLIVGSEVSQNAFTPAEVKNAIRDYVAEYGGRIIVLGGEQNTQWLQPLFHVGISGASPGIATPDPTHPLLTVPNELDYASYDYGGDEWDFTGGNDEELFNKIVGTNTGHILSASATGAFGDSATDGVVLLTTYLPHAFDSASEAKKFFANLITYGRYHYLFMDLGPEVPTQGSVATASRTAIMDKTKDDSGAYVELIFILYLWKGDASSTSSLTYRATPSPPTELAAATVNDDVVLTWATPSSEGSEPITGYGIYRGTSVGSATLVKTITSPLVLTWTDTSTTYGTTYYYNVTAINGVGQSSTSNMVSATPSTTPSAPQGLTATGGAGLVSLSWTAPSVSGGSTITNYSIYRGLAAGGKTMLANISSNTSFVDATVGVGTTYYYHVVAHNARGASPDSNTASASPTTAPSAPASPAAVSLSTTSNRVTWTAAVDNGVAVAYYRVYGGTSPSPTTVVGNNIAGLTFDHTGLTSGQTWFYRVSAVNVNGVEGPQSAEVSATVMGVPDAPVVTALGQTGSKVALSWTTANLNGATITGYEIRWGTSASSLPNTLAHSGTGTSTTHTGLSTLTTYYYQVRSQSNAGPSAWSTVVFATPLV